MLNFFLHFFVFQVVYFTNSGSEANDLAMFMARMYTGTFEIIGLRWVVNNSYLKLLHSFLEYFMQSNMDSVWIKRKDI